MVGGYRGSEHQFSRVRELGGGTHLECLKEGSQTLSSSMPSVDHLEVLQNLVSSHRSPTPSLSLTEAR